MLQRIQSLLLLIVIIIQALTYFIPVLAWENENTTMTAVDNLVLAIFNGFIILFLIFTVFQFKKRKAQIMYVYLSFMMVVLYISAFLYFLIIRTLENSWVFLPTKSIGMYLLMVNLILCLIAARKIKKDEDLVKSIDRIR